MPLAMFLCKSECNTELFLRVSDDHSKNIYVLCYKMQYGDNDDGGRKE